MFLLSPHDCPPSGCEDLSSHSGNPGSLGAGAQGGSRVLHRGRFVQKKKKVNIRICELELLGQGGSEGREKGEGGGEREKGKGGGGQGEKEGQEESARGWSSPFCLTPSNFSCH